MHLIALIIFLQMLTPVIAAATDFGIVGQTFKIAEEPFIQMLKKRLDKVDIAKAQEKMQARAKEQVENPKAASGISTATASRIFYFDPTYILDKDALLPCGTILHKAGTKVNPLEHMDLNRRIFFIDARNQGQIIWLKEQLHNPLPEQKEPVEDRIILVGGSVFKLQEELGARHVDKVYFDQAGELTTKFGIKASPAILQQEGLMLQIEEIVINQ